MTPTTSFEPQTIPYVAPGGRKLVLRIDMHHGYKSYWVETDDGILLFRPRFYSAVAVSEILHDAEVAPSTS